MTPGDGRMIDMTKLYRELFDIVDSGVTIVMPSEDAVRSFLTAYVLERKRSILKKSCISMADYINALYPKHRWLQKADDAFRILFASELVRCHKDKLTYFIPEDSTEDFIRRAIPFIAGILPELKETSNLEGKFRECTAFIEREYRTFLEKAERYEENWLEDEITMPTEDCLFAFPVLTPRDERRLNKLRDLGISVNILLGNTDTGKTSLEVYESQKSEIRNTMLNLVEDMTKRKLNPNQLAITVTDLDTLRPYLEKDARLFDIKLSFKKGTPLDGTPGGKYLHYSRDLYDSNYDTTVIRNFTMDSSIPLKDRSTFREYTKTKLGKAVSNVEIAADNTKDKTDRILNEIDALNKETDPEKMLARFDEISSSIFKNRSNWNSIANNSYNEIRSKAESFSATAAELKEKGLIGNIDLYPLFTEIITGSMMPKDEEEGIAVYEYPESAGLHFSKHYVLNVSEDKARTRGKAAEFLSDYEIVEDRPESDTTENIIRTLKESSDNTIFSCSLLTYAGAALPLMGMQTVNPTLLNDPWKSLHITEQKEEKPFSNMVKGYDNAKQTSLSIKEDTETIPDGLTIPPEEVLYIKDREKDNIIYSATLIDNWNECPYKCYLEKAFNLQESEKYEINENYSTHIGTAIHKAMQDFMEEFKIEPGYEQEEGKPIVISKRMGYSVFQDNRARIKEELEKKLNEALKDWKDRQEKDSTIPPLTEKLEYSIKEEFLDNMTDIAMKILNTSEGWICEVPLHKTLKRNPSDPNEKGYEFTGKADLVTVGPTWITGNSQKDTPGPKVDIIDYKTNSSKLSGKKQFYVYMEMLESAGFLSENDLKDGSAMKACYQYLKLGSQSSIKSSLADREKNHNSILDTAEAIEHGDWHAEKKEGCKRCIYRSICRMDFGFAEGESDNE